MVPVEFLKQDTDLPGNFDPRLFRDFRLISGPQRRLSLNCGASRDNDVKACDHREDYYNLSKTHFGISGRLSWEEERGLRRETSIMFIFSK
jgi:hypothetical protein